MTHKDFATRRSRRRTHLFTVRLWCEAKSDGQQEIRGKVQHVLTGEVEFFREWSALEEFLAARVTGADKDTDE
ncbi:MAG: hypothetical protein HC802_21250 [Caldilineaceae bacterium]|nr:hypothetical protein [Caldilineaceae bacterium]